MIVSCISVKTQFLADEPARRFSFGYREKGDRHLLRLAEEHFISFSLQKEPVPFFSTYRSGQLLTLGTVELGTEDGALPFDLCLQVDQRLN